MPRYDNALACMRFSQKTYCGFLSHVIVNCVHETAGKFTSCYNVVKAQSHYDAGGAPVRDQASTGMNRCSTGMNRGRPGLHREIAYLRGKKLTCSEQPNAPWWPYIIGTNLLTTFHEDRKINVAFKVLTRFYYSHNFTYEDKHFECNSKSVEYNNSSLNSVNLCLVFDQEAMWISYNNIEKLKGINVLKKLKVLYIRVTNVKDMSEFSKLVDLPNMKELGFVGNPLAESGQEKLPKLKRLDVELSVSMPVCPSVRKL
ncbi:hypothetical protein DPMN_027707 [Dreissena polymorpha]|uniref:Uncharacterized protein n=1 Tax=Dreissena polymorpha TaxID=45954 RepID=A0A9D4LTC8_DREPO|nr:hypothetical protein DPMN_027707 [Dreissena polymorpha]